MRHGWFPLGDGSGTSCRFLPWIPGMSDSFSFQISHLNRRERTDRPFRERKEKGTRCWVQTRPKTLRHGDDARAFHACALAPHLVLCGAARRCWNAFGGGETSLRTGAHATNRREPGKAKNERALATNERPCSRLSSRAIDGLEDALQVGPIPRRCLTWSRASRVYDGTTCGVVCVPCSFRKRMNWCGTTEQRIQNLVWTCGPHNSHRESRWRCFREHWVFWEGCMGLCGCGTRRRFVLTHPSNILTTT